MIETSKSEIENLASLENEIKSNITFVEKYKNCIKENFDEKESQIIYKQLGVIVFSCIEASWKEMVHLINTRCQSIKCAIEKCKYCKFNGPNVLNYAAANEIYNHLYNCRILYLSPKEEILLKEMQQLRNHVHLTRVLTDGDCSSNFNVEFVDNLLNFYYISSEQTSIFNEYFHNTNTCLKICDDDAYNDTSAEHENVLIFYHTQQSLFALRKLLFFKEIDEDQKNSLKYISNTKINKLKILIDNLGKMLYYEGANFQTGEEYDEALDEFYSKLKKYLSEGLINRIEKKRKNY